MTVTGVAVVLDEEPAVGKAPAGNMLTRISSTADFWDLAETGVAGVAGVAGDSQGPPSYLAGNGNSQIPRAFVLCQGGHLVLETGVFLGLRGELEEPGTRPRGAFIDGVF